MRLNALFLQIFLVVSTVALLSAQPSTEPQRHVGMAVRSSVSSSPSAPGEGEHLAGPLPRGIHIDSSVTSIPFRKNIYGATGVSATIGSFCISPHPACAMMGGYPECLYK